MNRWILSKDKMPPEHDSDFIDLYGTDQWEEDMYLKSSDRVFTVIKFDNGYIKYTPQRTYDGEWEVECPGTFKVVAWMPLPKNYEEIEK